MQQFIEFKNIKEMLCFGIWAIVLAVPANFQSASHMVGVNYTDMSVFSAVHFIFRILNVSFSMRKNAIAVQFV